MTRLGNWMLRHPRSLAWLGVMAITSLLLDLLGVGSVSDLGVTP